MVIQLDMDFESDEQGEQVLADFPEGELLEITKVERQKKSDHRYIIHFGAYNMTVHEDVMIKYRMITGNSFMKADLEEIVVADERQRAYVEGLRYLERKPRTAMEMTRRLRQKEIGRLLLRKWCNGYSRKDFLMTPCMPSNGRSNALRTSERGKCGFDKSYVRKESTNP